MHSATSGPILVVEDDMATSEFFVDMLNWNGYDAVVAPTGAAALIALREHPVRLVLLDLRLPDTDGITLFRRMRAVLKELPIILLTADRSIELNAAARMAGINHYFPKPVDPDILLTHIATLIAAD
jgi:DNA-binding response OmpR family regulator